jgi:hypothetical protein
LARKILKGIRRIADQFDSRYGQFEAATELNRSKGSNNSDKITSYAEAVLISMPARVCSGQSQTELKINRHPRTSQTV